MAPNITNDRFNSASTIRDVVANVVVLAAASMADHTTSCLHCPSGSV